MADNQSDESDDGWRFSVDEVGPDDADDESDDSDGYSVTMVGEDDDSPTVGVATADSDDAGEGDGNVAGTMTPDTAVEPGTPSLENTVFATAGAILTALVFAALVLSLDLLTIAAIAGGITVGAGLLYVFFRRYS